jgi:hypothetical protein
VLAMSLRIFVKQVGVPLAECDVSADDTIGKLMVELNLPSGSRFYRGSDYLAQGRTFAACGVKDRQTLNVAGRSVPTKFATRGEQTAATRLQNVEGARSTKFRHLNPADTRAEQTQSIVMSVGQEVVNAVVVVGSAVALIAEDASAGRVVLDELREAILGEGLTTGTYSEQMAALKLRKTQSEIQMQKLKDTRKAELQQRKDDRQDDRDDRALARQSASASSSTTPTPKARAKGKGKAKAKAMVRDCHPTPESDALLARWAGDEAARLALAREKVDMGADWNLFVRSWGRPDGVENTVSFLERSLKDVSLRRCWVLLAVEDESLPAYVQVLRNRQFSTEGTWFDRVIIGVKGAADQRVFAGRIFEDLQTNVIMCDDNIKHIQTNGVVPFQLENIFEKACNMMDNGDMTLWGVEPDRRLPQSGRCGQLDHVTR